MNHFYVYILECANSSFYTGITNNIQNRINQHNGLEKGGAKYTRANGPVKLIYKEKHPTKSDAMKREWEIKQMSRSDKILLINK